MEIHTQAVGKSHDVTLFCSTICFIECLLDMYVDLIFRVMHSYVWF